MIIYLYLYINIIYIIYIYIHIYLFIYLFIYVCLETSSFGCRQAQEETSMWELGPPRDESEELLQLVAGLKRNYCSDGYLLVITCYFSRTSQSVNGVT